MTRRRCTAVCLLTAICVALPGGGCVSSSNQSAVGRPVDTVQPDQHASRGNPQTGDWLGQMIFTKPTTQTPAVAGVNDE